MEIAWVGLQTGGVGSQGNHQGRTNHPSQVDGVSDIVPACCLCAGRAQQMNSGLCQHFCLGDHCPTSPRPDARHCVPPHISMVLFELQPQRWSIEGVSLSESLCGPFKRNCLVP